MERPHRFRKTGAEPLTFGGRGTGQSVLDFWRWSVSDLVSNATRGRFAEFIVGSALGIDFSRVRDEWAAWDLETERGLRIEVKSAAYIQSWSQNAPSKISFSIAPSRHWSAETNVQSLQQRRLADVYVFALLAHRDPTTIDPTCLEQWSFHVVGTRRIDDYMRSQHSITLPSLDKLVQDDPENAAGPIGWPMLRPMILRHRPEFRVPDA